MNRNPHRRVYTDVASHLGGVATVYAFNNLSSSMRQKVSDTLGGLKGASELSYRIVKCLAPLSRPRNNMIAQGQRAGTSLAYTSPVGPHGPF